MDEIAGPPVETLAPYIRERIAEFFSRVPFNDELELKLNKLAPDRQEVSFPRRDRFVGHYVHGNLHGGVIAAALDVAGGMMAMAGTWHRLAGEQVSGGEIARRFNRLGTIDLRVDYLQPGKGESFVASASLLRSGNKLAVARMELRNECDQLLAVGTGTYLCG